MRQVLLRRGRPAAAGLSDPALQGLRSEKITSSLRDPGAVLLVSGYELGHQPLALASPLGFLERAGYRPAALDLAVEKLDEARVRRARFVGFSVPMHTAMRVALHAAERVRALNPDAHLCFYGLYAPLQRERLCAPHPSGRPLGDSILGGELEAALVDVVDALEGGRTPPGHGMVSRLVRLPFAVPSRAALPSLARYAHLEWPDGRRVLAGHTEASRGCLHRCRHCPIPAVYAGRFFIVPVETVLADVRAQVAAGARHLTLGDPDFLNGPRHAMSVVRALHREFPSLTFDVTIKVEHLLARRHLLPELRSLGCLFVTTAVESLSDRVLHILDKGHTVADVVEALAVVRAAGITVRPTFVPFTPWSTLYDHLALFDFLEEHSLLGCVDPVQATIRLLVPAGSLLLGRPELQSHLEGTSVDPGTLSYRFRHPDPRMDDLQRDSAALVHRAEDAGESARETWRHLRALAFHAAGRSEPHVALRFPTEGAPRLTESWFC